MGGLFYVSVCPSAKPLAKKKGWMNGWGGVRAWGKGKKKAEVHSFKAPHNHCLCLACIAPLPVCMWGVWGLKGFMGSLAAVLKMDSSNSGQSRVGKGKKKPPDAWMSVRLHHGAVWDCVCAWWRIGFSSDAVCYPFNSHSFLGTALLPVFETSRILVDQFSDLGVKMLLLLLLPSVSIIKVFTSALLFMIKSDMSLHGW